MQKRSVSGPGMIYIVPGIGSVALSVEMETGPGHQHSGAYCFNNPILGQFVTFLCKPDTDFYEVCV